MAFFAAEMQAIRCGRSLFGRMLSGKAINNTQNILLFHALFIVDLAFAKLCI